MQWTEPAYAKLNLTLDILGRLPNGYHSLDMVMQSVSLKDDVTLTLGEPGTGIRVECGEGAPSGQENIVWKAADAFFRCCDRKAEDVCFHIEKHTPSQAGMGGRQQRRGGGFTPFELRFSCRLDRSGAA